MLDRAALRPPAFAASLTLALFSLLLPLTAPASAETRTVKVSGSVDATYLYKENFDLRKGNDTALVPMGNTVPGSPGSGSSVMDSNEAADWFMSAVQVEVAAELSGNASVVINLFNQRDWNSNVFDGGYDAAGTIIGASTANAAREFDLGVDLAYVTLKEAFCAPLTLTLGRQDITFGRGLILGDANTADPQGSIAADELSVMTSYDAARATLDLEPWTLDLAWISLAQGDANDRDSRDLFWLNANRRFSGYNAVWEGYLAADRDASTADNGAAVSDSERARSNRTYMAGTRAQFDPVANMTLGAEAAHQWGDYAADSTDPQFGQNREAWLFNLFGEYRWAEHAYQPYVGLEYALTTGDDTNSTGTFEGWNGLYWGSVYGVIRNDLETYYQTALIGDGAASSNLRTFFISSGFAPMEDLRVDGQFFWFWSQEDIVNSTHGGSQLIGGDLGTELDLSVTYDHTDDVTLSLGLAWFFPGDVYSAALTDGTDGATGQGPVDTAAKQASVGISVAF
jgi:hypothetical protein